MNKHEFCPDENNLCAHGEDEVCPAFNAVAPQELQPSGQGRGVGEHPATTPAPAAASPHESAGGKPEEPKQYKFSPYTDTMVAGIGYISIKDYEILRAHAEQLQTRVDKLMKDNGEITLEFCKQVDEQIALREQAEARLREAEEKLASPRRGRRKKP